MSARIAVVAVVAAALSVVSCRGCPGASSKAAPSPILELAGGGGHFCARHEDRKVRCWGQNPHGQTGSEAQQTRYDRDRGSLTVDKHVFNPRPAPVEGLAGARQIAAGEESGCAVADREVFCWGGRGRGHEPRKLEGLEGAVEVALGDGHGCARLAPGGVACWGRNDRGQLGLGAAGGERERPAPIPGLESARGLALGQEFSCALVGAAGEVFCWGEGDRGQTGDPARGRSATPRRVTGVSGATQIAAGYRHACALVEGGRVACWGEACYGALGVEDPDVAPACQDRPGARREARGTATPVPVVRAPRAVELRAGGTTSCVRTEAGKVVCWGDLPVGPLDELGLPPSWSPVPREVPGIDGAERIGLGANVGCAVVATKRVACWGSNHDGQLGDGTTEFRNMPVVVSW